MKKSELNERGQELKKLAEGLLVDAEKIYKESEAVDSEEKKQRIEKMLAAMYARQRAYEYLERLYLHRSV